MRLQSIIDGPERSRPRAIGSFGDTGIPVAVCRKAGKRYGKSSTEKVQTSLVNWTSAPSGKARAERRWFNDPREVFRG